MTEPGPRHTEGGVAEPVVQVGRLRAAADALDRMVDGVLSLDPSLTLLYANGAAARLTRADLASGTGRPVRELLEARVGTAFELHAKHVLDLQQPVEVEISTPTGGALTVRFDPAPSGVTVCIAASAPSAAPGAADLPAAVLDDASQPHYRALLDAIAQGVIETTPGGDFLLVNRAFARLLGYDSAEDLLGHVRTAGDLYVNMSERPTQVRRAGGGETDDSVVAEVRRKDGSSLWLRARATPWFSATGELVSMQAILEESTEQPLTQQALREASEGIESKERLLLAEAIHDEPLQLIAAALLRLDSLQGRVPPPAATVVEQVTSVLDQAMERLRRLIVTLQPPDLQAGLGPALLGFAQGIFLSDETSLDLQGPAHVPLPKGAKTAAYRILREALINARKHARARHVLIGLEIRSDSVVLVVQDDGVGADDLNSESGHIGLATMRTRATALNAVLTIHSQPGAGTTVSLEVPRSTEPS